MTFHKPKICFYKKGQNMSLTSLKLHVVVTSCFVFTLHLNGLTGRWTIMCVFRVCFWTKVLKQMWHWKGLTLAWINMCLFRLADSVNSREHTSHLNSFMPWADKRNHLFWITCRKHKVDFLFFSLARAVSCFFPSYRIKQTAECN